MIHLEKVNWDNYKEVLKLKVTKEQEEYVADNDTSLIHAFLAMSDGEPVYAFAIYNDDKVVGFIQMGYDDDWSGEEHESWLNSSVYKKWEGKKYYFIWRFMIDKKYQKKGYGKEALIKAIEFLRTKPSGDAEYITLSYERTNEVAKKLYASLGFYEPEEFAPFYEDNDEIIAICKF